MAIDDPVKAFMSIPTIEQPIVSPNSDRIAFFWDKSGQFELFICDIKRGEPVRIASNVAPPHEHCPAQLQWHPDGARLFFHKHDNHGDSDIYQLKSTGETTPVVTANGETRLWDICPDGEFLYYRNENSLYRRSISTGETDTIITEVSGEIHSFAGINPEGTRIVYGGQIHDEQYSLYIADADGSSPRKLAIERSGEPVAKAWHPNGNRLLVVEPAWGGCWGIYKIESDDIEWKSTEYNELPIAYLGDSDKILVKRRDPVTSTLFVYSDTKWQRLKLTGTARFSRHASTGVLIDDESILIPRETETRPRDLLEYSLTTDEATLRVEAGYGEIDPATIVEPQPVTIETSTDKEIAATIYDSGQRPSPALVHLYGAQPEWAPWFRRNVQYLVHKGYTVLQPVHDGDPYTTEEHETHAEAGRWLQQEEWIDDTRIGAIGHSHGGYNVYMQMIQHPDVWTGGVAMSGVTDLIEQFAEWKNTGFITSILGDSNTNTEAWREQSPITHVENFQGPLLLLHPENDYVSIDQARQFQDALAEEGFKQGTDFVYQEVSDQGHVPETIEERIQRWGYVEAFLERYL